VNTNPLPGGLSREASSFRDPAGFIYRCNGEIFRQINLDGKDDFDLLVDSGLYVSLVQRGQIIPHEEVDVPAADPGLAYKIIRPAVLDFISYPYEWSFSQLKDAALLTLAIQKEALRHDATLKDSSAFNVQFWRGKPVLMDTLSFTHYEPGAPWDGYRQFCQHFLAPLALMSLVDIRLSQLLRIFIDGIPLDLASRLLPRRTRLPGGLYMHIHLHASAQKKYAGRVIQPKGRLKISKTQLLGLVESLEAAVKKLQWDPGTTNWADYECQHNYSEQALQAKKEVVQAFMEQANPAIVWDMGANTGLFSRLAAEKGSLVVALDLDPGATEMNYLACRKEGQTNVLPLVMDLTNPSPGIGWRNHERSPLEERLNADLILALALLHHLAISNNLPLAAIAEFFAAHCEWLAIEFVAKQDEQVQKLLLNRHDIFPDYQEEGFESAFQRFFSQVEKERLPGGTRTLYLFRRL
jgi:ribosomal protein L11 methylase PrmA